MTTSFSRAEQIRRLVSVAALIGLLGLPAGAQGTKADYARADGLRERMRGKVFRMTVRPHWSADGNRLWYRNDGPEGTREFVLVDATKGTRRAAFDHAGLAEALGRELHKPQKAGRLAIDNLAFREEGTVDVLVEGKTWRFSEKDGSLKPAPVLAPEITLPAIGRQQQRTGRRSNWSPRNENSPDGKWRAVVADQNVALEEKSSGKSTPLAKDGTSANGFERGVFWSPDSKHFVALRTEKGDERKVYLIESTPKGQVQPRLQSYNYLKPGDKVPITKPHLFDAESKREVPIRDELFANPYDISEVHWSPDSSQFTFLFNQRGHQVVRIIGVDAATGRARAIVDETSKTFVDYSQKMFAQYFDKTNELIWMSERSGWNHLYLIDTRTGRVKNPITAGEWVVRDVDRVDEEKRQIWFRAGGIRPGQDPYHVHFARVNFDGTGLVILTEGDGTHTVDFSPDQPLLSSDIFARIDMAPVTELRRSEDGSLVAELERADLSDLESIGWRMPERFVARGRDGTTDIFGVIYRPTEFESSRKYPVIEQIYAGPQGAFVPKAFATVHGAQPLAELGFVVVQIDGMGTNWRSKAFHDVCWKNLGDAGLPDRILWMKAAAAKYPEIDLTRVGVYGGSAGGQNAMGAVLFHPEFYKAAAADCGCHDNRMDKIWWNEAWMGWPVGPEYAASSNVDNAHRLQGKLLLTVGEMDRNVDPASTMQVVAALIKANKDFEFIVVPGGGHGSGSGPYGERRRRDFFVRHLLGVEPRSS